MKSLSVIPQPPLYESYLESIRSRKHAGTHKAQLTTHGDRVVARYHQFLDAMNRSRLDQLTPLRASKKLAAALRSCYGSNKGATELKSAIKAAQVPGQLKYCPMCGTTLPSTHDHYLPASVFPEFAVYPLNLIPCCSLCNSKKDNDWLDQHDRRQYLHFYSDPLPNATFLQATLFEITGFATVGAQFSLIQPVGVAPDQWELIETHFKRLSLLDLYTEHANDEIDEMLRTCAVHLRTGGHDARNFLFGLADEAMRVWGLNHWRGILMRELANARRFDEFVAAKMARI